MIEKVFIIHRAVAVDREKYINELIKNYPNYEIVEPIIPKDLKIYGGNVGRKKESRKIAELSLTLTNIFIYEKIIKDKLNNVIIFEDDAIQIAPIPKLDLNKYVIYLHNCRFTDMKIRPDEIYDCQAMFYPTWQNTKKIVDLIKLQPKLLIFDVQLQKIKQIYKLNKMICQVEDMIFIQAVGKSSIIESYNNNRYKNFIK